MAKVYLVKCEGHDNNEYNTYYWSDPLRAFSSRKQAKAFIKMQKPPQTAGGTEYVKVDPFYDDVYLRFVCEEEGPEEGIEVRYSIKEIPFGPTAKMRRRYRYSKPQV